MGQSLIILDLDGTLVDSRRDIVEAVNRVRRHYGLGALPLDVASRYIGGGIRVLMERSLQGSDVDRAEAVRLQRQFYRERLCVHTTLYPGVAEGLRRLRERGCRLALVSNKPLDLCEGILEHFRLRPLFGDVRGDGNVAALKPDPAAILELMAARGSPPEATYVVGDGPADLEAARRAGARAVYAAYGFGSKGSEAPWRTIRAFADLVALFPARGA